MASPVYPKTAVNKLGRLANRGTYDYATVHSLINTCPVLHVSFNDPQHEFPVVLPMLGCTGNFSNQTADPDTTDQDIYIHGYVSGRVFKSGKDAEIPITIAATHLDGLVLALSAFHNSCNYRSAVVYGHAILVTSEDEKLYAMQLITNNLLPTRWESSRNPPTSAEMTSTSILRIKIASASAKIRSGGPSEERADLKNSELVRSIWTGVVPRWSVWGDPVRGDECGYKEDKVEDYIEGWRLKENQKEKATAYEAIEKKK